jgi:hypothetical protein
VEHAAADCLINRSAAESFVETNEHRRFREFCVACQKHCYIGLCYGPPGVGKTLSARRFSNWPNIEACPTLRHGKGASFDSVIGSQIVFYTPPVVNAPGRIERDISHLRAKLLEFAAIEVSRKEQPNLDAALKRLMVIGAQNGPTSASKTDPPGFRGTPVGTGLRDPSPGLHLCLLGLLVTVRPPGETESGSAGTQPDKG